MLLNFFPYVFPSHSFLISPCRTSCSSAAGIASPRHATPLRHLGLPGCRRHHRTHFRSCRWSIRIDPLRWTETRVRQITFLSIPLIPYRRCPRKGRLIAPKCMPSSFSPRLRTAVGEFRFTLNLFMIRTLFHRWKTETNKFRTAPWRIESIPTIVKLKDVRVPFILFLGLFHSRIYSMFPLHPRC